MPERPPQSAPKDGERPPRCDAARNRERIVHAAREVFGRRGLGVPLDDVAKHAGVGVGTMYRRFPTKEALVRAVFEHDLAMRQESAERALAHPDPWQRLVDFLMTREKPTVSSCSSLATSNWAGSTPSRPVPVRGSLRGQPFGCARAEAIGRPERGATDFRAGAGQLS